MKVIKVSYVSNIEKALAEHLKKNYELRWIEKSADVEIRFYLKDITSPKGFVCLARQYWDELHPGEFRDQEFIMPAYALELRCESESEYQESYKKFKKLGALEPIPNDDLENIAAIPLKSGFPLLLVNPSGYTWE